MNELTERVQQQLPDRLEDLTQFVLVGKAKLAGYMLKIQTVNKLSVAQEIRDQTLKEAQDVSTALIAAEQRIGELLLEIPKAQGHRSDLETSVPHGTEVKPKSEVVSEMGYGREYKDFQRMAQNPDIVQQVIDRAIANGDVVTKSQVMKEIKAAKEEERRQLRDEIEKRDQKIDSLIDELENGEPVKVVERVEVVPDDYQELQKRVAYYQTQAESAEDARIKATEESVELKRQIREMQSRGSTDEIQKKLDDDTGFFTVRVLDFIRKNGGYVWITDRLENVSEDKRRDFIRAVYALDAFSKQMIENIGGYGIE